MHNERGSLWNKWDLHVHTPFSHQTTYGDVAKDEVWDKFLTDLESLPEEVKVIGINDYFFLDGYQRVLQEKQNNNRLKNIDLILPVIELRLRQFAGTASLKKINYHIIFSDIENLSISDIEQYFIKRLEVSHEDWQAHLSRENLIEFGRRIIENTPEDKRPSGHYKTGANNATFELSKIDELLKHNQFKNKTITAIGKAEWNDFRWDQAAADKKHLIDNVDIVFTASEDISTCLESRDALAKQNVNKKVLHCSDAHHLTDSDEVNRIGHNFTWIKADTTFDGLRYAIEEYEDRVFIGSRPHKLDAIDLNPTKYIDSIEIRKTQNAKLKEIWFNHKINFNYDLVAIIGNKGSGKSALADVIGLFGNTHNDDSFSFLNKERFSDPKTKKSSNFIGNLNWYSGPGNSTQLDSDPDIFDVEQVKYIPQNHLEKICNEVSNGQETEFDKEIKKVIFSHIDKSERLEQYSLDALIKYKAEETNKKINSLKSDLSYLNMQIAELEIKSSPEEMDKIRNLKKKKNEELEAHTKSKPLEIKPPKLDSKEQEAQEATKKEISEVYKTKEELEKKIKEASNIKSVESLRSAKLQKIIQRAENFRLESEAFEESLTNDLKDFGVPLEKIYKAEFDVEPLQLLKQKIEKKLSQVSQAIDETQSGSLSHQLQLCHKKIESLQNKLNEPNLKFQKYLQDKERWQKKLEEINGDPQTPNSLAYYQHLENQSLKFPEQIKQVKAHRFHLVKKIYSEIRQLADIFQGFYTPVQNFVKNHSLSNTKFDFNFSVEMHTSNFVDLFLDWIDSRVSGVFSGVDGRKEILRIVDSSNFESEDGIIDFFKEVMGRLHNPKSNIGSRKPVVLQQLRNSKELNEFYDFLFSLDYLRPKYALKAGDKELGQLSPGQKGLLLLTFYLIVDKSDIPLVLDQPEENLDNQTVYDSLVPFIKDAKKRRQIFIVTHNPNLAVVCDADQIIWSHLEPKDNYRLSYEPGSIENPVINKRIVDVLEGTYPAFHKRDKKYFPNNETI